MLVNSIFGVRFHITNLESVLEKFGMHQMTWPALSLMVLLTQMMAPVRQTDLA